MLKFLPLVFVICGSAAGAAIVEGIPKWDNPPSIPQLPVPKDLPNKIPDAFKDYICDQYPITKAYPYLVQDWYVLIHEACLLYTSPSPRDRQKSRMPSSA